MEKLSKCQCPSCGINVEFDPSPLAPGEVRHGPCPGCGADMRFYETANQRQHYSPRVQVLVPNHPENRSKRVQSKSPLQEERKRPSVTSFTGQDRIRPYSPTATDFWKDAAEPPSAKTDSNNTNAIDRKSGYYCPRCYKYLEIYEMYSANETVAGRPAFYAPVHMNSLGADIIVPIGQATTKQQINRCRTCNTELDYRSDRELSFFETGWFCALLFFGPIVVLTIFFLIRLSMWRE